MIQFHPSVSNLVRIAALQFSDMLVVPKSHELWEEIELLVQQLRDKFSTPAEASTELVPARQLYRNIGIDPTKNRPSSEALLRRTLKGHGLYQINSVVDTCNFCSLQFLLPIGLYDFDKIEGGITLRIGMEGEGYEGIRKDRVNVSGKITLADDRSPFGNPSSDSARTMITESTQNILFVIFAPQTYSIPKLQQHSKFAVDKMLEFSGGKIVEIAVIPDE